MQTSWENNSAIALTSIEIQVVLRRDFDYMGHSNSLINDIALRSQHLHADSENSDQAGQEPKMGYCKDQNVAYHISALK